MIQQTIKNINKIVADMRDSGGLDHRVVDIAVEAVQRWIEYLDELELSATITPYSYTAKVEGKTVKFKSIEDVATWLTSF